MLLPLLLWVSASLFSFFHVLHLLSLVDLLIGQQEMQAAFTTTIATTTIIGKYRKRAMGVQRVKERLRHGKWKNERSSLILSPCTKITELNNVP